MLFGAVVVCGSTILFVWSYKVIFSEKYSHIINVLGHKNGPTDRAQSNDLLSKYFL